MLVMVVDDSHTMRLLIGHVLRRIDGVELVEATDGEDALAKLATITPAAIVTDLNMPIMDGLTLIARVRAQPALANVPVVAMTTAGAMPDPATRPCGAVEYVTKPIQPDALVEAVSRALQSTRTV